MIEGNMTIGLKNERGVTLTQEYGFTVQEEEGKVLAFDLMETADYGVALLFGDQVFFLKFWDDEDLTKAESIVKRAFHQERLRRNDNSK